MLDFLYSTDYETQTNANSNAKGSPLVTHASVYALAEKYCIPVLKNVSKQKFVAALEKDWKDWSFVPAIEIVYTTTVPQDRGLRDVVIAVILQHQSHIRKQPAFMLLIKHLGGFAVDIVSMAWSCVNEGCPQTPAMEDKKKTKRKRYYHKCMCGNNHKIREECDACDTYHRSSGAE